MRFQGAYDLVAVHGFIIPSLDPFASEERLEIPGTVNHSQNINSFGMGAVQDENPVESRHPKYAERFQAGMLESRAPSHFRLCGKQGKGIMSGD